MKKLILAPVILLALSMGACRCTVERQAVEEVERSHGMIATQLLKYVDKDPALDQKAKGDWKGLVESDKRNIEKLKKALE
jgi:hypothetical protein